MEQGDKGGSGQAVLVNVPATTANIGPGFDCLGAALNLNNTFHLRSLHADSEDFELIVESSEGSHLRGGPENLIYRSAQRVWREIGCSPRALEARVHLAVPPARGLGSSATAIVAGLLGANALEGEPLSKEKLLELAIDIEGHPDNVVPSLLGGLCLTARAVVAIPSIRLSTADARRAMPRQVSIPDAVANLGSLTLLLQGLRSGNGDLIADGMHDRLHEPYRWPLIQGGMQVREAALKAGAWGCVISGAGPSVLALGPRSSSVAMAAAMEQAWLEAGVSCRAECLELQQEGSHWTPLEG